jgi:hypothetical protein
MLMSLKNDQQRFYGEERVSPHKDYNSSWVVSSHCLMIVDCANPFLQVHELVSGH